MVVSDWLSYVTITIWWSLIGYIIMGLLVYGNQGGDEGVKGRSKEGGVRRKVAILRIYRK